ncbi:hypothetical protein [Mameliella sediminis]|uniref:hypothetical protein n=1 Tax=Mameliella sediminis TaxID=2836866 RepID=UPI001C49327B|nr:hypothetical protein [Mameliella sediminis]MBV7395625.1 hypothetical protein [Mameliella sediminis]
MGVFLFSTGLCGFSGLVAELPLFPAMSLLVNGSYRFGGRCGVHHLVIFSVKVDAA